MWKEERKKSTGGRLVPGALFMMARWTMAPSLTEGTGGRVSCRGKVMWATLNLLRLSHMEDI